MLKSKNSFTLEEIAEEVVKLIKYTLEMQTLTKYQGGEKANIQKLNIWSYGVKRESEGFRKTNKWNFSYVFLRREMQIRDRNNKEKI